MSHLPMRFYSRNAGFQVVFIEGGGDATQGLHFYQAISSDALSPVTYDTTLARTGTGSLKFLTPDNSVNSFSYAVIHLPYLSNDFDVYGDESKQWGALTGPGFRMSFWFRISAYPTSDRIFFGINGAAKDNEPVLKIGTSGNISLWVSHSTGDNQYGSTGPVLLVDTWYRICYATRWYRRYFNRIRIYLDGSLIISADNTGSNIAVFHDVGIQKILFGYTAGGNGTMNFDDLYVDQDDSTGDTGDIRITHKRPASNNVNDFSIAVGNNPANRWTNVNEQPLNVSNGWLEEASLSSVDENYGIENAATGDLNISGYTGVYPATVPATGVYTQWSSGLYIYECGTYIAINSDTNTIVASKSWAYIATSKGTVNAQNRVYIYNNGEPLYLNAHNVSKRPQSPTSENLDTNPQVFFQFFDSGLRIKPIRFHSVADNQPMIFSSRD